MGLCARRTGIAVLLGFAAVLLGLGGQARAASLLEQLEKNFWLPGPAYEGVLPPCDAPAALNRIAKRFAEKERTYWNSKLEIVGFKDIRETAFRPWAPETIARRFCSGIVHVSDGRFTAVHYLIAEDQGMIGASWGVEWCVVGLDRNWAYNPACKMAQP
jgi:hypothetical protein